MNFQLQMPDMLAEARMHKQKPLWLECLQALGVFLLMEVSVFVASLPITVAGFLFSDFFRNYSLLHGDQALINLLTTINTVLSLLLQIFPILVVLLFCKRVQKRKAWTLGFKRRTASREYGIGMLAGFLMMTLVAGIAWAAGALQIHPAGNAFKLKNLCLLLLYFVGFLIQAMSEEVFCRGYFIISLGRKRGNMWLAVMISSLLFACLHLLNPGITLTAFLNLTLFGIFAGVYFLKRGDLWGIGALHGLWNFTQGNIWGVRVSGLQTGPSLFLAEARDGMELLNGGAFGLEGGLVTTAVLILGTLILLKLPQKDIAEA